MGVTCSKCVGDVVEGGHGTDAGGGGVGGSGRRGGGSGDRSQAQALQSGVASSKRSSSSSKCHHGGRGSAGGGSHAFSAAACSRQDSPDPAMFDLMRQSVSYVTDQEQRQIEQQHTQLHWLVRRKQDEQSREQQAKQRHHHQPQCQLPTGVATVPASPSTYGTDRGQFHLLYKQQLKGCHADPAAANPVTNLNDWILQQQQQQYLWEHLVEEHMMQQQEQDKQEKQQEQQQQPLLETTTTTTTETGTETTVAASASAEGESDVRNGTGSSSPQARPLSQEGLPASWRAPSSTPTPTRLIVRNHPRKNYEEGVSGTHVYAMRYPSDQALQVNGQRNSDEEPSPVTVMAQEQAPKSSAGALAASDCSSHRQAQATGAPPGGDAGHGGNKGASNETPHASGAAPLSFDPLLSVLPAIWPMRPCAATMSIASPESDADNTTCTAPWCLELKQQQQSLDESKENIDYLFLPSTMALQPRRQVNGWVTVSSEHDIYVADVGMSIMQCDQVVQVTEQVCRGQYAAYTYAKQTLGCREFPALASVCQPAVHSMVHSIVEFSQNQKRQQLIQKQQQLVGSSRGASSVVVPPSLLALDDREPHMVKYDVTKKERQKLDMHTDKSEWTFLIALSNGCGMDYEGGGTYFECLDATVHIQRGHALIFPGKLRHCGQRITAGLRFLLVGFLVDKDVRPASTPSSMASSTTTTAANATAVGTAAPDGGDPNGGGAAATSQ